MNVILRTNDNVKLRDELEGLEMGYTLLHSEFTLNRMVNMAQLCELLERHQDDEVVQRNSFDVYFYITY